MSLNLCRLNDDQSFTSLHLYRNNIFDNYNSQKFESVGVPYFLHIKI